MRVNDVFESIAGGAGGFPQGAWVTGIRLQGCNLMCRLCPTPQTQGKNALCYEMEIPAIFRMVRNKRVLITGGEPLLQEETPKLIKILLDSNHIVQVETNGGMELPSVPRVHWVVGRKCPSSGMKARMFTVHGLSEQINRVRRHGAQVYVKWEVLEDEDVEFMFNEMKELVSLGHRGPYIISPVNADGKQITNIVEYIGERDFSLLDYVIFSTPLNKILKMP